MSGCPISLKKACKATSRVTWRFAAVRSSSGVRNPARTWSIAADAMAAVSGSSRVSTEASSLRQGCADAFVIEATYKTPIKNARLRSSGSRLLGGR